MKEKKPQYIKLKKNSSENSGKDQGTSQFFKLGWDTVFRILGSITGIALIFTVFLFLFGYFEFAGESEATDIPIQLYITGSNELILVGGMVYLITFIVNVSIFILIFYFSKSLLNPIAKKIFDRIDHSLSVLGVGFLGMIFFAAGGYATVNLEIIHGINQVSLFFFPMLEFVYVMHDKFNSMKSPPEKVAIYASFTKVYWNTIRLFVLTFCVLLFFILQATDAIDSGRSAGCKNIIEEPTSVTLYSSAPMVLEGESKSGELFVYKGYYLLFFDNNNYHLYRDVDPITLKPKSVFVIDIGNFNAVKLETVGTPSEWQLTEACPEP